MFQYSVFNKSTGEILKTGHSSLEEDCLTQSGGDPDLDVVIGNATDTGHYIVNGVVTDRPIFPIALIYSAEIGDLITISDLPSPCSITLLGDTHEVTGGVLELDATMPAEYEIAFSAWPYIDAKTKVTVHAV